MVSLRLALVVDRLDEARELGGGGADRTECFLVVHPYRPDEADRPERTMEEPVAGADERDLGQCGMLEVVADADERSPRVERRLADHLEKRGALLDELEEVAIRLELLASNLAEEVCGAADE